jgi:hypothetical protein
MERRVGRCLCGELAFAASGDLAPVINCHCGFCRRVHGAVHDGRLSPASKPGHHRARCGSSPGRAISRLPTNSSGLSSIKALNRTWNSAVRLTAVLFWRPTSLARRSPAALFHSGRRRSVLGGCGEETPETHSEPIRGAGDGLQNAHREPARRRPTSRLQRTINSCAQLTLAAVGRHTLSAGSGPGQPRGWPLNADPIGGNANAPTSQTSDN